MRFTMRRLLGLLLALLGAALLAVGPVTSASAATPTSSTCNYPASKCACPSLSLSTTVPDAGEKITVTGRNFEPDATVALVLKPVRDTRTQQQYRLKTLRTDSEGVFSTEVVMPRNAIGTYDLHAVGAQPSGDETSLGCPADPTQRLQIGGDSAGRHSGNGGDNTPTSTAFTGFNLLWLLLLAAVLVALGIYAVRRGRTKREVVRSIHG